MRNARRFMARKPRTLIKFALSTSAMNAIPRATTKPRWSAKLPRVYSQCNHELCSISCGSPRTAKNGAIAAIPVAVDTAIASETAFCIARMSRRCHGVSISRGSTSRVMVAVVCGRRAQRATAPQACPVPGAGRVRTLTSRYILRSLAPSASNDSSRSKCARTALRAFAPARAATDCSASLRASRILTRPQASHRSLLLRSGRETRECPLRPVASRRRAPQ